MQWKTALLFKYGRNKIYKRQLFVVEGFWAEIVQKKELTN